jgi:hypothetical protein
MKSYKFKSWMEYADFGLDITQTPAAKNPVELYDTPIDKLNVEYVIKSLKNHKFGEKSSKPNDFAGELQWGESDGALQLVFSPLGGVKAGLRKLIHDQEGNPTWICKKVVEVRHFFDTHPDSLSFLLQDSLNEMDQQGLDAPQQDWKGLERLVLNLASTLRRRTTQKIFIYEGIRMIKENEQYIIHFGCTGYGRQRAGQKRLDQFAIHCTYNQKAGTILITGTELGDKIDKYRWIYDPSNFMEYFVPTQHEDEICKAVLAMLNSY